MKTSALITMILILTSVWGGLGLCIRLALKRERQKDVRDKKKGGADQ